MATFYAMNTIKYKTASGPSIVFAGSLINDALVNTTLLKAAGLVLAASADTSVAAAALVAQKRKKQGAPIHVLDSIMLASGLLQLGLT
jgi:hypothetical protein